MPRTFEGIQRAFDDLVSACQNDDDHDPRGLQHRSRVQILPDLYAAALVAAEAKENLSHLLDEARRAGMSEDIRAVALDNAKREAER